MVLFGVNAVSRPGRNDRSTQSTVSTAPVEMAWFSFLADWPFRAPASQPFFFPVRICLA